jgi:hypothetical protein
MHIDCTLCVALRLDRKRRRHPALWKTHDESREKRIILIVLRDFQLYFTLLDRAIEKGKKSSQSGGFFLS